MNLPKHQELLRLNDLRVLPSCREMTDVARQVAATRLEPGKPYLLVLVGGPEPPNLAKFAGVAIVQTFGPPKACDFG